MNPSNETHLYKLSIRLTMGFNQYSLVSTWGEFFCAHTNVLWWKTKIKWCKSLMTLLGPYCVICVYTKMHMKEQVHTKTALIQYVLLPFFLWFITTESSWNMNRKKAHNIFYFTYISKKHRALRLYLPSPQRVPWCIFYPSFSSWWVKWLSSSYSDFLHYLLLWFVLLPQCHL